MIDTDIFVHPHALIEENVKIGSKTRVWAFAHILFGAIIGDECNICDHTFIEGNVRVGNNVTIKCGVYLWDGVIIENDVFVGPCVTFTNDYRPRSKCYPNKYLQTHLKQSCSIGANATLLPVKIGQWAMVGAGSVVIHDVADHALVLGNPAKQKGWVCCCGQKLDFNTGHTQKKASCSCGCNFILNVKKQLVVQV